MVSKTLIYSIISSLLFCLGFIHVHNYPKLTDSYIFVILGNSEKVINRRARKEKSFWPIVLAQNSESEQSYDSDDSEFNYNPGYVIDATIKHVK